MTRALFAVDLHVVRGCSRCPYNSMDECCHPKVDVRALGHDFERTPEWCPLRESDSLVRLDVRQ